MRWRSPRKPFQAYDARYTKLKPRAYEPPAWRLTRISPEGRVSLPHTDMRNAHAAAVRALVIDDDPAIRAFVERSLRDAGYETTAAPDAFAACDLVLESGPPDVVVTDEAMPGMTGHDFSRWLRQRHPQVKVLYLAGYADPIYGDKSGLWEDEGYLDKPCSVRGLLQAVSLLLFRQLEADVTYAARNA